jgi:beta-glucosidase
VEIRAQHNLDRKAGVVAYHHGLNCWSPVINIMRHWAWGRNDETYGECPVLSGAFAKSFVQGLQGNHSRYVAATAGCKHFVVHGGPDNIRTTFSANVTQRDWATTFLPQFESCVESGGLGMMCSFNAIRGVPACANHRAMDTWARQQWNFSGCVHLATSKHAHMIGMGNTKHELTKVAASMSTATSATCLKY